MQGLALAHRGKSKTAISIRLSRLREAGLVEMHSRMEGATREFLWYPPGVWERKNKTASQVGVGKLRLGDPTGEADADVRALLRALAGISVTPSRFPHAWSGVLQAAWRRGYVAKVPTPFRWICTPLGAEQVGHFGPLEEGCE